jgi:hypothetical protein
MANSKKLIHNGLNEQTPISRDPAKAGMDTMSDKKTQKPMPTPKQSVTEKGKSFTIC